MNTKTILSKLWMLIIVLLLTACGGGGSDAKDELPPEGGGGLTPDPNVPVLSDVKYELSPKAVLVPQDVAKQIKKADLVAHTLTLPATATKPEVGQTLIINTPSELLHDGLLAKVSAVTQNSDGSYAVSYTDAELKDAFKMLEIPEQYIPLGQYVEHVYDANGKEVKFTKGWETSASGLDNWNTRASGQEKFKIKLPEIGWPLGWESLTLTPKMTVDLAMRYVMMYGDYKIDYANVKVDAEVEIGADLALELKSGKLVDYRKPLLSIVCAGIPIGPIVITPGVEIVAVFQVDGKLCLEASISYKRTVHANVMYQQGSLTATSNIDPAAPDALTYSFGPKWEGGVNYGLSVGPFLGIYGKTFALNVGLDVVLRESVSAKLDLIDLVKKNLIEGEIINAAGLGARLDGNKWNFAGWEGFMYNQAIVLQPSATLYVVNHGVGDLKPLEVSYPVDSRPIVPQVKIEKDFLKTKDDYVTLTMHMPKKSLLDNDAEFYAVWTNKDNAKEEYKAPFDFNDEKRDLLNNDNGVDIESKCQLKKGYSYLLKVYMEALGVTVCLYDGKLTVDSEITVDPAELTYEWEGGSQTVKVIKQGYPYSKVVVDEPWNAWVSAVINSEGNIDIAVQPNLTFDDRNGMVRLLVSTNENPGIGEQVQKNIAIKQSGIIGVSYSPRSLEFTTDGGSQEVTITNGPGFRYSGVSVSGEGADWCKVQYVDGTLTVTVEKYQGTEDRECEVVFYLSNSKNPGAEDKCEMKIKVVQKGLTDGGAWVDPVYFNIPREGAVTYASYGFGTFGYLNRAYTGDWLRGGWSADYDSPNRFKNQFYIAIPPNTTGVARRDTIKFLFGATKEVPLDQRYCIPVVVRQEGGTFTYNDLKSLVVGKWHHHIISSSAWQVESNYDLTINADGTYTEVQKEDNINGMEWHTNVTESGTYTITGYSVPESSSLCIQVNVSLNYTSGPTTGTKTAGSRTTTWEIYPHFMRYIEGRSRYYDRQ